MTAKLLTSLLVVLIAHQAVGGNEDYFKNSVFKALKEKNGQFSSQYKAFSSPNQTMLVDDQFSFKSNVHALFARAGNYSERFLFVNVSEVYTMNERTRECTSNAFSTATLKYFLFNLAKEEVYNSNLNYRVFGANVLLEVLQENIEKNKDAVKCEDEKDAKKKNPKKCTITFKDKAKVEYHFVDKDGQTMIPEKVVAYEKQGKDWKVQTEVNYLEFKPSFDAKPIVNASLPAGYGCKLVNQDGHPQIEPYFGRKFETEIEVYVNISTKNPSAKKDYLTTKTVQVKANVNLEKGMVVVHALDKETSKNATAILDTKNHAVYSFNSEQNTCIKMQVPKESLAPANMSQPEMEREFKQGAKNFTYLGEYQLDDVLCDAFEAKLDPTQLPIGPPQQYFSNGPRRHYAPDVITATVYYPKDRKHWSAEPVAMPKRTEVRVFDSVFGKEFVKVTVDVKQFNPKPKDPEKIDTSKCTDMSKMMG